MRTHVEPPRVAHCTHCAGELRLKEVLESVSPTLDLDEQIFVCVKCGREQTCIVSITTISRPSRPHSENHQLTFAARDSRGRIFVIASVDRDRRALWASRYGGPRCAPNVQWSCRQPFVA